MEHRDDEGLQEGVDWQCRNEPLSLGAPPELVQDEREDASIDLILGEAWEDLPAAEDAEQTGEDG